MNKFDCDESVVIIILNKCEKFILKEICKGHFSKN